MKKLKLSLENLQGGEILSREQLKKVVGGYYGGGSGVGGGGNTSGCWITKYDSKGNVIGESTLHLFAGGCPDVSTDANNYCVQQVITSGTGVYRCKYNCGCLS